MAVPTQKNHKTVSPDSMGVPVLFSIKNVQPLILSSRPATGNATNESAPAAQSTNSSSNSSVAPTSGPTARLNTSQTSTPSPSATPLNVASPSPAPLCEAPTITEYAPKARRTSLLSKAVATGFVIMLVVVVIRFSVPSPKLSTDVAGTANTANHNETPLSLSESTSIVTGPESSDVADPTRIASLPAQSDFNLGDISTSTPSNALDIPALPPLLSDKKAMDFSNGDSLNSATMALQPPVSSPDVDPNVSNVPSLETNTASRQLAPFDLSSATTPADSQRNGNDSGNTPEQNLHVLDTLTPDRSLAEFEWLFRNATRNPVIPYSPVSSGGHNNAGKQPLADDFYSLDMPAAGQVPTNTDPNLPSQPVTGYQPITIPAHVVPEYEKNVPSQPANRYQPIRQPLNTATSPVPNPTQTAPSRPTQTQPATSQPLPYQPLAIPGASPPNTRGTSYGYPPVQNPPPSNSTSSSSIQQ